MSEAPAPVARQPSYMSKEEPPAYEQTSRDRQIEYCTTEGIYPPLDGIYPPPDGVFSVVTPPLSARPQPSSQDGRSQRAPCSPEDRCVKLTLPPLHMCMAVTCLICNFIIPGLGKISYLIIILVEIKPNSQQEVRVSAG